MSLKKQAIGSVKWTSASTVITSAMQLIQIAVLTRYLDKKDFGLMAMALFVIGISKIFIDMGLSNALIYKQRINKYQLSSLFWLNIFLGVIIFGIILLLSPFIAYFYDTHGLKGVIDWTAVTFLILPWGQQMEALLRKDLRFKSLSIRDIISKGIGLIVAILLAIYGFGVYALVYANLASALISVILLLFLGLQDYRPAFLFSYRSLKNEGFFSFGLFQMGEKLINYFNTNFDTILIGKLLGMEALGLYNIAKIVAKKPFQVLNPILTKVAFPIFSKMQNDLPRLKNAYLKTINLIAGSNAPLYLMMIIFARPIVIIAFGRDWIEAVPILQLLAIGTLFRSIGNPVGSLQLARGRADLGFYWNVGVFLIVPLAIWAGSYWGLLGVAWALLFYRVLVISFPSWFFLIRPLCKATYKEYLFSFWHPFLIALTAGILPFLLTLLNINLFIATICGILLYAVCYLILTFKWNLTLIRELKQLLPLTLAKRFKFLQ